MATFHFLGLLNISHRTYGQMRAGMIATTANLNICNMLRSVLVGYSSKQTLEDHLQLSFTLTELQQCPATTDILPLEYRAILSQEHLPNKVKLCFSGNATGYSVRFFEFPLIAVFLQAEEKKRMCLCANMQQLLKEVTLCSTRQNITLTIN